MQDWKDALAALRNAATLTGEESPTDSETISPSEASDGERNPYGNHSAAKSCKPCRLKFFYEKKGRAGKPATIITGFDGMSDTETAAVASRLKQKLGCGGSARGGEILLQGDRRDSARKLLEEFGLI